MKLSMVYGLLFTCGVGLLLPAHASDWAESSEVKSRLDQLRGRPIKPSAVPNVGTIPEQPKDNVHRLETPWRHVSYDNIAPPEPAKRSATGQGRVIEVAEADKLGYQLNNAEMRDRVLDLYRRPDIVVEQYVIGH